MPKKENILSEQEVEKYSDSTSMTGLSTEDTTVAINQ